MARNKSNNYYIKVPFNLSHVVGVLSALLVTSSGLPQNLNFAKSLGRGIAKEVVAVKVPLEEAVVSVGSSQCSNVKKIIGVEYDQLKDAFEPDLTKLTLNFISSAIKIAYNLSSAAQDILQERRFDPKQKLVIFVHGFTDDPTKNSFKNISNAFFAIDHFNIFSLDGSSLIRWLYLRSTTYIRFMGTKLGETLAAMVNTGLDPASIHLIGHSLGSHISSFAGKQFTALTGKKVGRISGLDPAGPCFSHIDPELRLKSSDADFVDVIHSDAGVYGLVEAIGHVDFYPNGGSQQPNCLFQTCSHSRAWLLYAESVVNPDNFPAVKCEDWDSFRTGKCDQDIKYMGYACTPDTRGNYFLRTGEDPPYGLGLEGTKYVNNEGFIKSIGAFGTSLFKKRQ